MATIKVYDQEKQEVGSVELAPEVFEVEARPEILNLVVRAQLAAKRAGTHSAKTRAYVSGGGVKPWKQKGTGRARAGLKQSPVGRGGGVAFGPHPRDYSLKLNKKVARLAFRRVVSDRISDGTLVLAEDLSLKAAKTKELAGVLKALGAENALLVVKAPDDKLSLAARNLPGVEVVTAARATTYKMMVHAKVVVARAAWEDLSARLVEGVRKETVA